MSFMRMNFSDDTIAITQRRNLQILIGIFGVSLPLLLYVFLWTDMQYTKPLQSISHYYFTRVNPLFISVVSLQGFFLIIYKGKDTLDYVLSALAGLGALTLVLFPTSNIDMNSPSYVCAVTTLPEGGFAEFRIGLHYVSASMFFLALAAISFFVFTKTHPDKSSMTPQKKIRNAFYRVFAITMIVCLLIIFLGQFGWLRLPVFGESLTFWMETIAVECFGFSWLIKAEVFLKDKPVNA